MGKLNIPHTRDLLQKFDFDNLFIEELNWTRPTNRKAENKNFSGVDVSCRQVAELSGVVVLEIATRDAKIPDAKNRKAIHKEISKLHHENLLIFIDKERTQSLWYWAKREDKKIYPRDHTYFKGQPGDLFISKLNAIVFDISDFEKSENVSVVEVARRLRNALDVERVTKRFYGEFQEQHLAFIELIEGIPDEQQRRWYASVLLNRMMFIYFLQKKGFVDGGDQNYLQSKLTQSKTKGKNRFYSEFLKTLFFEGFAKPEDQRSAPARQMLGKIKYLNGGLFLPHLVELANSKISIPDKAFENLLELFQRYSWNLNDTPGGEDNEINPDVLGYIFEKYINQKAFGAYYTRPEITEYLCERTIQNLVLDKVNSEGIPGVVAPRHFDSIGDLLLNLDANLCRQILFDVLPSLSILDPACGSGAFLVAAMKTLINIYSALIGKIKFLSDQSLTRELKKIESEHPSVGYFIKKRIITNNLFGVDIMEEAVEIAKLRLFLALVAAANHVDDLEPLPNIDFNIQAGNSLIGLIRVDASAFDAGSGPAVQKRLKMKYENAGGELGFVVETTTAPSKKEAVAEYLAERSQKKYQQILEEKNRLINTYRDATSYAEDLRSLRDKITEHKQAATETLNQILLDEFRHLEIKYEQATWDGEKNTEGRPIKRPLKQSDIEELKPFHWGFEFDEIINQRGGFDAIITNPPWEVFQTNEKEFFQEYVPTIQKKKLRIEDWEKQRDKLLSDPALRNAWFLYASRFPHQWAYFKRSVSFKNQTSLVDGRAVGNKPNLYNLFIEQCQNLLRAGGYCGIVVPSGIYTDLGAKQLREMLFSEAQLTGLFCFENRQGIFENVDSRFKFVVLTFEKGGKTKKFPAAFMRHDVNELDRFPHENSIAISVDLVRKLSPDSLSVSEFKDDIDISIAEKMLAHPLFFGDPKGWMFELYGEELNMTRSSEFFLTRPTKHPVYEGGMIWQFQHQFSAPRYWVKESALRKIFQEKRVKRIPDLNSMPKDLKNDYEVSRIAIRKIASNTNERTLIVSLIPPNSLTGNSLSVHFPFLHTKDQYNTLRYSNAELLFLIATLNSFVVDYILRSRMTTNLNLFYLYQLPIPRLTNKNPFFGPIVERTARLVCTSSEFDDIAHDAGVKGYKQGVTEEVARNNVRAELDAMIAKLYALSEEEFAHILDAFPIVPQPVKDATLIAYRKLREKNGDLE